MTEMIEQQEQMWDVLVSLDSETLLEVITKYHGMQIIDEGFAEFLVDEGLMEQPEEEDEDDDEEPEDGDYIMSDCGPLGSRTQVTLYNNKWAGGMRLRTFEDEELAVEAIKEDMKAQKYRPNVWKRDDHGGIILYDMD